MIDEAPEPTLRITFNNHMLSEVQSEPDAWSHDWRKETADLRQILGLNQRLTQGPAYDHHGHEETDGEQQSSLLEAATDR